uniref:BSD domain-containing protein n=1 Tax=Fagus sylvatica TaxID=28930 RepID=A0A2N9J8I4_FAGSY
MLESLARHVDTDYAIFPASKSAPSKSSSLTFPTDEEEEEEHSQSSEQRRTKKRDSLTQSMDLWNRARSLAEETAKRTQDLSIGASKFSDLVSETAKRSKEIAAEASKRAEQIKAGSRAVRRNRRAQRLRQGNPHHHVSGFSFTRQDLTEWQQKHANLVLSTVKEISKLRYELCPRVMKERKFWRIYFILVNRHLAPYEKRYMEDLELKSAEQVQDDVAKESTKVGIISKPEAKEVNQQSKTSSSSTEQDLDAFLLGDPGDTDDGPDDAERDFDDDFDKMVDSSDDEKEKS